MANCLIVGCGYVGKQVAKEWLQNGHQVYALTRSPDKVESFASDGIVPVNADWYDTARLASQVMSLPPIDNVLISVSHAPVDGLSSEQTHVAGLTNLLPFVSSVRRLVYVSTTGVYAHRDDGGWVDETSHVLPTRPGSIAAVAAERWLQDHFAPSAYVILRAAGIYGPGRVPRLDSLRKNEPISIDPESYLNLIHLDDLAGVIALTSQHLFPANLYNVCDGQPVLRKDYYEFICNKISAPPPVFSTKSMSGEPLTIRTRGDGSKRIDNSLLVKDTHYAFRFPDFRSGLSPLL